MAAAYDRDVDTWTQSPALSGSSSLGNKTSSKKSMKRRLSTVGAALSPPLRRVSFAVMPRSSSPTSVMSLSSRPIHRRFSTGASIVSESNAKEEVESTGSPTATSVVSTKNVKYSTSSAVKQVMGGAKSQIVWAKRYAARGVSGWVAPKSSTKAAQPPCRRGKRDRYVTSNDLVKKTTWSVTSSLVATSYTVAAVWKVMGKRLYSRRPSMDNSATGNIGSAKRKAQCAARKRAAKTARLLAQYSFMYCFVLVATGGALLSACTAAEVGWRSRRVISGQQPTGFI
jgi:hypothetical protein